MYKATGVTYDKKWGNQYTGEAQSYVGPMKNLLTLVRL
jgi:hypothetical protein